MRVGQRPHKGLSAWAIATVILLPGFWVLPVMIGVLMLPAIIRVIRLLMPALGSH